MIVATAAACLALNLYHEARGEPVLGRYAVAMVTMRRAENRNTSVCQEVFRDKQFSWANRGVRKVAAGWKVPMSLIPKLDNPAEAQAWKTSKIIAETALAKKVKDITNGADHYHASYVRPVWAKKLTRTNQIGKHIFYAEKISQS